LTGSSIATLERPLLRKGAFFYPLTGPIGPLI
jgi:hypothetical protein